MGLHLLSHSLLLLTWRVLLSIFGILLTNCHFATTYLAAGLPGPQTPKKRAGKALETYSPSPQELCRWTPHRNSSRLMLAKPQASHAHLQRNCTTSSPWSLQREPCLQEALASPSLPQSKPLSNNPLFFLLNPLSDVQELPCAWPTLKSSPTSLTETKWAFEVVSPLRLWAWGVARPLGLWALFDHLRTTFRPLTQPH